MAAILESSNGDNIIITPLLMKTIIISARVDLESQIFFENILATPAFIEDFDTLAETIMHHKRAIITAAKTYSKDTLFCKVTKESINPSR